MNKDIDTVPTTHWGGAALNQGGLISGGAGCKDTYLSLTNTIPMEVRGKHRAVRVLNAFCCFVAFLYALLLTVQVPTLHLRLFNFCRALSPPIQHERRDASRRGLGQRHCCKKGPRSNPGTAWYQHILEYSIVLFMWMRL